MTELDALEEFHPGELARLVTEFIVAWRDPDHAAALREAADEARRLVSDVYEPHAADITAAHGRVAAQYAAASDRYRQDLQRIDDGEEITYLQELVAAASDDLDGVEMPPRPVAVVQDTADEWLYRSDRDYMTQMPFFSRRLPSVRRAGPW